MTQQYTYVPVILTQGDYSKGELDPFAYIPPLSRELYTVKPRFEGHLFLKFK